MMLRKTALAAILCALAACGADGDPERPEPRPAHGVTITGSAALGIAG